LGLGLVGIRQAVATQLHVRRDDDRFTSQKFYLTEKFACGTVNSALAKPTGCSIAGARLPFARQIYPPGYQLIKGKSIF
jgi:hypothetical protein